MFNFVFLIAWINALPKDSLRSKFVYFEIFFKNEMAFFQSQARKQTVVKVKCYRFLFEEFKLKKGDLIWLSGNIIDDRVTNCIWVNEIQRISLS